MSKKVIIVHGWSGRPDCGWMSWLNKELSSRGFEVIAERMPNPDTPEIKSWIAKLKKIISKPDEDVYFVGHSIGCQTILRYLESLPEKTRVGGVVFVAGWLNLINLETQEEKDVSKQWLETPIKFEKIKNKINKLVTIFSDNDPWVPLSDSEIMKKELGAKIILEKNKGHYIENETLEIPVALKSILEMAK